MPWTAKRQAFLSITPRACSNSYPLSQWCHPTISSSVIPFSSRLQSFPASRSFPMCQFFTASGQSIGISASASVLPMNIQMWKPPTKWKMLDYLRTMSRWPQASWSLRTEKINPCDIILISHPSANQRTVPADHISPLPSIGLLKWFAETLQRVRDFWGREPPVSFHEPAINLSLLQTPMFQCVWPHHTPGMQTCINSNTI